MKALTNENPYHLEPVEGSGLSEVDYAHCIKIIKSGGAVDPASARRELRLASHVVVVRKEAKIVAVGAIKRTRSDYSHRIAIKSRFEFAPGTPELGYVSVDRDHQHKGLSLQIVNGLLGMCAAKLFATTSSPYMRSTLERAGFQRRGQTWKGTRPAAELSLWIRP